MVLTGASGPGLFLQLLDSSCVFLTFSMHPFFLLLVQLFNWLTVVSEEESL